MTDDEWMRRLAEVPEYYEDPQTKTEETVARYNKRAVVFLSVCAVYVWACVAILLASR